jgi:selT/selW/selH-like putative selenoprotein
LPQAASLADAIQKECNITPELIQSSGGVFDVIADGKLIFSKKTTGRFPENTEVIELVKNL